MKGNAGGAQQEEMQEERQEMNELVDSDPELYGGDVDEAFTNKEKKFSQRDRLKAEIKNSIGNQMIRSNE